MDKEQKDKLVKLLRQSYAYPAFAAAQKDKIQRLSVAIWAAAQPSARPTQLRHGQGGYSDPTADAADRRRMLEIQKAEALTALRLRYAEKQRITAGLALLPEVQQRILALRLADGCSWNQIAGRLHLHRRTVYRKYQAALAALGCFLFDSLPK